MKKKPFCLAHVLHIQESTERRKHNRRTNKKLKIYCWKHNNISNCNWHTVRTPRLGREDKQRNKSVFAPSLQVSRFFQYFKCTPARLYTSFNNSKDQSTNQCTIFCVSKNSEDTCIGTRLQNTEYEHSQNYSKDKIMLLRTL